MTQLIISPFLDVHKEMFIVKGEELDSLDILRMNHYLTTGRKYNSLMNRRTLTIMYNVILRTDIPEAYKVRMNALVEEFNALAKK